MQYSVAQIANMALGRVGARGEITDINEGSPNAKKILNVWNPIFQEVLSERDWKFAKTRTELQLAADPLTGIAIRPVYAYCFAWVLPGDMLRFVRPVRRTRGGDSDNNYLWWNWGQFPGWYRRDDWPFHPYVYYKVEAVATAQDSEGNPTYQQCAITDYDGRYGNVKINYIRLITDYTQLLPGFVNCLANRLAAEIAVNITEDMNKKVQLMQEYKDSLNSAESENETMDYQKDEAGSEVWERAGRYFRRW